MGSSVQRDRSVVAGEQPVRSREAHVLQGRAVGDLDLDRLLLSGRIPPSGTQRVWSLDRGRRRDRRRRSPARRLHAAQRRGDRVQLDAVDRPRPRRCGSIAVESTTMIRAAPTSSARVGVVGRVEVDSSERFDGRGRDRGPSAPVGDAATGARRRGSDATRAIEPSRAGRDGDGRGRRPARRRGRVRRRGRSRASYPAGRPNPTAA